MSGPGAGAPWPPRSDEQYRAEAGATLGPELAAVFAGIRLLVLDADGILTSGHLIYGAQGEAYKAFHSRDGLGLVMARTVGLERAVLTGRHSAIVERRAAELRFGVVKLGRFDKLAAFAEILAETGCRAEETCYMGDDLIDLPVLARVALPVTVPAAPAEVREACRWVTRAGGGEGAVREVTDLILKAGGLYGQALQRLVDKDWAPTPGELSSDHAAGKDGR